MKRLAQSWADSDTINKKAIEESRIFFISLLIWLLEATKIVFLTDLDRNIFEP
jgi:hypothetical protein